MTGFLIQVRLIRAIEGRGASATVAVLAENRSAALRLVTDAGPAGGWIATGDAVAIAKGTVLALGLIIDEPRLL